RGQEMHCKVTTFFVVLLVARSLAAAQSFVDPGFEAVIVPAGQYLRPVGTAWSYNNDASIVRPYSAPEQLGFPNTWSATFAPFDGAQYACTYAGGDRLEQAISFSSIGTYTISVHAAAPSGVAHFPHSDVPLDDGVFTFTLDGVDIGTLFTIVPGTDWTPF